MNKTSKLLAAVAFGNAHSESQHRPFAWSTAGACPLGQSRNEKDYACSSSISNGSIHIDDGTFNTGRYIHAKEMEDRMLSEWYRLALAVTER